MISKLEIEEAKRLAMDRKYAWVRELSTVHAGMTVNVYEEINWDEVEDARFFDNECEVHFFKDNDGAICAVIVIDKDETCLESEREYVLEGRFAKSFGGKHVIVRSYISEDEDGQEFISCNRLAGIR